MVRGFTRSDWQEARGMGVESSPIILFEEMNTMQDENLGVSLGGSELALHLCPRTTWRPCVTFT